MTPCGNATWTASIGVPRATRTDPPDIGNKCAHTYVGATGVAGFDNYAKTLRGREKPSLLACDDCPFVTHAILSGTRHPSPSQLRGAKPTLSISVPPRELPQMHPRLRNVALASHREARIFSKGEHEGGPGTRAGLRERLSRGTRRTLVALAARFGRVDAQRRMGPRPRSARPSARPAASTAAGGSRKTRAMPPRTARTPCRGGRQGGDVLPDQSTAAARCWSRARVRASAEDTGPPMRSVPWGVCSSRVG